MKKAVILVSGGLDSATIMAIAKEEGFEIFPISFDYGQKHKVELTFAKIQSEVQGALENHKVITIENFLKSALTTDIEVPKYTTHTELGEEIPVTYVPARNIIFLSLALGYAESIGAYDIFIGINAIDYSNYPDCRPEFIEAFTHMANVATKGGIESDRKYCIHAPLINMSKAEIIQTGLRLGVDYAKTMSCYDPPAHTNACGQCAACLLRIEGFKLNNLYDPVML